MLNKILLIGGTTVASVGAGVGGYYIFHQSSSEEKTIEWLLDDTIKGKQITAQNKTNSEALKKWQAYITENTKEGRTQDMFGVSDWTRVKGTKDTLPDSYITACNNQLTIKVKDKQDQKYNNYINYCTIP